MILCGLCISARAASPDTSLPRLGAAALPASASPLNAGRGIAVPAPTTPLTLMALTDLALRNNPSTRAAWAQVRADAATLGIAESAYWPQVTGEFSATRSKSLSATGRATPAQTRYGPAINLSYLLWDFGSRSGQREAAQYNLVGTQLAQSQAIQNVILLVEQAYYEVEGYAALVRANRQSLDSAARNRDAAEQRRKRGVATVGDVYQARAAEAQARLAVQESEGSLRAARGKLAAAVGYPANTALDLVPWREKAVAMPDVPVETLMAQARKARPELLESKQREMAAQATIQATRGQGLPSLTLNGGAGTTWVSDVSGRASHYSVGATLNIPIFAGFADRYALDRARAQADLAQADTDSLLRQVELEVWQAYQDLQTAAGTLTTTETVVDNAKLAADVSQARYDRGLDSILNLLTAQSTLASARANRVQALVNYYTALAVLGHAVGGLQHD